MFNKALTHLVRERPRLKRSLVSCKLFVYYRMGRLKKLLYGKYAQAVLVDSWNGKFLIDVEDQLIGRCLETYGEYSKDEIEWVQEYLYRDSELLVVGAHIGTLVVPLAKCCRRVVAIEANPSTFELLKLNLLINGASNVEPVCMAASDKLEELEFVLSRTNSGGSKRMPAVPTYHDFSDHPRVATIQAGRLDDCLPGAQFDVVVMDIEGSEYFALKGMEHILSGAQVLFVEFMPHNLKDVSNVSVSDFLEPLARHFSWLSIPGRLPVPREEFLPTLQAMYDNDQSAYSIAFFKEKPS
jgi:FkbM family methyltransferase